MKPIILVLLAILFSACSPSTAPAADAVATSVAGTIAAQQLVQQVEESTAVPLPTETSAPLPTVTPTDTPEPTATKSPPTPTEPPTYAEPVVMLEFSGTGSIVTDDFEIPECWKAVAYWNVATNPSGAASLILTGYNKDSGDDWSMVNEFGMDVGSDGMSGSVLAPLLGGTYYFQTENTDDAWTVRFECQDGVAPVGTGVNIQGKGLMVTDNFTLPACNKSIFNWSVEPNSSDSASLIMYLCTTDEREDCENLVNEFQMDLNDAMTGQALQAVKAGDYFLTFENTRESWTVTWECKD